MQRFFVDLIYLSERRLLFRDKAGAAQFAVLDMDFNLKKKYNLKQIFLVRVVLAHAPTESVDCMMLSLQRAHAYGRLKEMVAWYESPTSTKPVLGNPLVDVVLEIACDRDVTMFVSRRDEKLLGKTFLDANQAKEFPALQMFAREGHKMAMIRVDWRGCTRTAPILDLFLDMEAAAFYGKTSEMLDYYQHPSLYARPRLM